MKDMDERMALVKDMDLDCKISCELFSKRRYLFEMRETFNFKDRIIIATLK